MSPKRVINMWGSFREWKDSLGMYHRKHGPAIESDDGEKGWMQFGEVASCRRAGKGAQRRTQGVARGRCSEKDQRH